LTLFLDPVSGGGGNLLLNVGGMPSGEIEARQADRLREIGAWLRKNGRRSHGMGGGPFAPDDRVARHGLVILKIDRANGFID
jgi:alpha-L-fucosidase